MQALQEAAISLLSVVLTIATAAVTKWATNYLKKKGILDQIESKKKYVDIVVGAVQQIYWESDGETKLKEAKLQLITLFNENKLSFTEEEIDLLIESAVKGMKDGILEGSEKNAE